MCPYSFLRSFATVCLGCWYTAGNYIANSVIAAAESLGRYATVCYNRQAAVSMTSDKLAVSLSHNLPDASMSRNTAMSMRFDSLFVMFMTFGNLAAYYRKDSLAAAATRRIRRCKPGFAAKDTRQAVDPNCTEAAMGTLVKDFVVFRNYCMGWVESLTEVKELDYVADYLYTFLQSSRANFVANSFLKMLTKKELQGRIIVY